MQLTMEWETASTTGDPVTYQHFVWVDIQPWQTAAYFLIPNGILAAAFAGWYHRKRKSEIIAQS